MFYLKREARGKEKDNGVGRGDDLVLVVVVVLHTEY